jgi:hypothetical protein
MIGRHVLVSKCLPDDMDTAVLKLRISCHCIEKDREMKNKKEKRSGNGDAFSLSRDGFLFPSFLAAMANGANLSPICHPRCITMLGRTTRHPIRLQERGDSMGPFRRDDNESHMIHAAFLVVISILWAAFMVMLSWL